MENKLNKIESTIQDSIDEINDFLFLYFDSVVDANEQMLLDCDCGECADFYHEPDEDGLNEPFTGCFDIMQKMGFNIESTDTNDERIAIKTADNGIWYIGVV